MLKAPPVVAGDPKAANPILLLPLLLGTLKLLVGVEKAKPGTAMDERDGFAGSLFEGNFPKESKPTRFEFHKSFRLLLLLLVFGVLLVGVY